MWVGGTELSQVGIVVQVSFGDMIACDNENVSALKTFKQLCMMWAPSA
jgi:hypothetical protein